MPDVTTPLTVMLAEDRALHRADGAKRERSRMEPLLRRVEAALREAGSWDALDELTAELGDNGYSCGCCLGTGKHGINLQCKCPVGYRRFPLTIAGGK